MKRGFTLIELLAVIVILAIIALIAAPIVVNIINDSKKESIKRSAEMYLDTVEKRVVKENLKRKFDPQYCEGESGEELTCYDGNNNSLGKIDIEIKNKLPKNIKLYFNNGKILKDETLELEIEGYLISSNSKGEIILKTLAEDDRECILYDEGILDGEKLKQSEYVNYTDYTEYTYGMDIATAYQSVNMTFTPATFDTITNEWIVEDTGSGHAAYYIIEEAGYYQITVENGGLTYVMNAQDEKIVGKYMQGSEVEYIENTLSEIVYLESGGKILIMQSTPSSNFYITKSTTLTNKCKKWRYKNGEEDVMDNEDYRGYYADVDGNGTVDGIIYADLAYDKSGDWYNSVTNDGKYFGTYSYDAKTNLNEYVVSSKTYKVNEGFGENKIIKIKKNKNNPRFYVMALSDFREGSFEAGNSLCGLDQDDDCELGTYYWYYSAYMNMNSIITSEDFGEGKENTRKMIEKWKAAGTSEGYPNSPQNDYDIWKHIQRKYNEGWYIPSRGEWASFADYLYHKPMNALTSDCQKNCNGNGNYDDLYGLSTFYWSSSQDNLYYAWYVRFCNGYIENHVVFDNNAVRLGTTF